MWAFVRASLASQSVADVVGERVWAAAHTFYVQNGPYGRSTALDAPLPADADWTSLGARTLYGLAARSVAPEEARRILPRQWRAARHAPSADALMTLEPFAPPKGPK